LRAGIGAPLHVALAAVATLLIACANTDIDTRDAGQRPVDLAGDEAGIWYVVDKAEDDVRTSGYRNRDPALNAYVQEVACRVVGEYCDDLRLYILDVPVFNASMYPNGMMIVFSGLLLRADNEAQFACVLGHEFGHYLESHSLEQYRKRKNASDALLMLQLATSGTELSLEATGLGKLLAMTLLSSYSREAELEADRIGFAKALEAGYDPAECAETWLSLARETAASDSHATRRSASSGGVFASHPLPSTRIETLSALADASPEGGDVRAEAYRRRTASQTARWLKSDLRTRDFSRSLALHRKLLEHGHVAAGLVHFYSGEAYRLRDEEGDAGRSIAAYARAAASADPPPQSHRAIADDHRKHGRERDAAAWYRRYLIEAPEAADRQLIESILVSLLAGARR